MVPTSSGPPRVLPTGGSHWGTRLCPGSRGGERPGWAAGGTGTGPRHLGAQHRVLVLAGARCNRRAVPCAPTPQPRCLSRPVPRHSCPSSNRSRVGPRSGPPEKGWHRHRAPQPGRGRGWGHGSALRGCPPPAAHVFVAAPGLPRWAQKAAEVRVGSEGGGTAVPCPLRAMAHGLGPAVL